MLHVEEINTVSYTEILMIEMVKAGGINGTTHEVELSFISVTHLAIPGKLILATRAESGMAKEEKDETEACMAKEDGDAESGNKSCFKSESHASRLPKNSAVGNS